MKLYYYNARENGFKLGNFGDDLNPWIWHQLIPEMFVNENPSTLFVGIGTLLNEFLPSSPRKIIFGSGAGYGNIDVKNDRFKVYFVRGRLTAKLLAISAEKAITDPAILVRTLYTPKNTEKKYKYAYMPHHLESEMNSQGWHQLCADCDLKYIDPGAPVKEVLETITATEVLFTEAMHGAIVADSLRVPWVPIKTNQKILEFKWKDWMDGLGVNYSPYLVKRYFRGISKQVLPKIPKYIDYQAIRFQLRRTIKMAQPIMSSDAKCDELHGKVCMQVEQLKQDYSAGRLV